MHLIVSLFLVLVSLNSEATITAGSDLCPVEFEGKVKSIIDEVGPERAFSVQKVIVKNMHNVRGDTADQINIEILKNGPFQVEVDKEYKVLLRNGKLCWIEQI